MSHVMNSLFRLHSDFCGMVRQRLRGAGLVVICASVALWPGHGFSPFGPPAALADDDDGGDDDGGDDGDDGGGGGGRKAGGGKTFGKDNSRNLLLKKQQRTGKTRQASRRSAARASATAIKPLRVRFELVASGIDGAARTALLGRGYRILEESPLLAQQGQTVVRLRVPRGISIEAARSEVRALSGAPSADLNHYYRPESGDSCSNSSCESWSLISWGQAESAQCGRAPVIGIVDTGINTLHEALKGQDIEAVSLLRDGLKPSDKRHGTAVAALIAGAPDTRARGLLPEAKIIAIDPFHKGERADNRVDVYDLVRAVDILVSRSPDAINLSLAGPPNLLLERSMTAAIEAGIPVIASVGNEGPRAKPSFPAAYGGVIAVTALDKKLGVYRRAGQGEHVDFAAPGVGIWTAFGSSGMRRSSGTSYAAPFVTAAAALIKVANPDASVDVVEDRLTATTVDLGKTGRDKTYGSGLIRGAPLCKALGG